MYLMQFKFLSWVVWYPWFQPFTVWIRPFAIRIAAKASKSWSRRIMAVDDAPIIKRAGIKRGKPKPFPWIISSGYGALLTSEEN